MAGLGVRVRPSGHRSFVWHGQVNGASIRRTIGPAALKTVDDARRQVPCPSGRTAPPTGRTSPRSPVLRLRSRRMGAGKPAALRAVIVEMGGTHAAPTPDTGVRPPPDRPDPPEGWNDGSTSYSRKSPGAANKALQLLTQVLAAAAVAGHSDRNPALGIKKNRRRKMARFLSAAEIDELHRVLARLVMERPSRRTQADIIRLLLLTGCRRGEILQLKWSEVEGGRSGWVTARPARAPSG